MGRRRGMDFCCCAVPLVNAGAYFLVLEIAFVSLVVGVLALAPPQIVATMGAIPTWSKALVAALGFITFVWQVIGLVAIIKEKTGLYRAYIRINFILTVLTIVCTLAFFAVSAARHGTALDECVAKFGNTPASTGSGVAISQATNALQGAGHDICNVFIWVQVGVMGGLIALMGLTQLYMCYAQRAYGQHQREALVNYEKDKYAAGEGAGDSIPLAARDSAVWEPREAYYEQPQHGNAYSPYETPRGEEGRYDYYAGDGGSPTSPQYKGDHYEGYASYQPPQNQQRW